MRHELVLIAITLIVLIAELATSDSRKSIIAPLALCLFAVHTIIGFLPMEYGSLFGGMFNSTPINGMVKNILNIGVLIVLLQAQKMFDSEINRGKVSEYFIVLFSTLIGMFYMVSAGDFLMFYIGLEIATIPLAALAAFNRGENKSAEAGIKLLLSSALSSGVLLYGLSMLYAANGSLFFDALIHGNYEITHLHTLALIFFFAGMAFKLSLVPFHLWAADVYEGAPVNVTSYLSVISKGAAAFIFTVVLYTVFHNYADKWQPMMYIIAILTMIVGNLFALRQNNLKRFLAFSSIAQAGFLLLGIISGTAMGMATVVYYILVYVFSNLAAFGVISIIEMHTGKTTISDLNGMYRTNPKLSLALMLALFSLAGIPPVAGFFGKFFLFTAAASVGTTANYILVLIALLNTIISLYYYLMPVKAMFINKNDSPIAYFKSDVYAKIGLAISLTGMVVVGFASPIFENILAACFGIVGL
jgi:NADH-quinone oxidoreductase subunit N